MIGSSMPCGKSSQIPLKYVRSGHWQGGGLYIGQNASNVTINGSKFVNNTAVSACVFGHGDVGAVEGIGIVSL